MDKERGNGGRLREADKENAKLQAKIEQPSAAENLAKSKYFDLASHS